MVVFDVRVNLFFKGMPINWRSIIRIDQFTANTIGELKSMIEKRK
jgi:hypothetical protein